MKIAVVVGAIALIVGMSIGVMMEKTSSNQQFEQLQTTLNQILIEQSETKYQLQKYVIGNQPSKAGVTPPMPFPEFSNRDLLIEIFNRQGGKK